MQPSKPIGKAGIAVSAALMLFAVPVPAHSDPVQIETHYSISLLGLPVAELRFTTSVNQRDYEIKGSLKTSALGDLGGRVRGTAAVSGRLEKDRLQATRYRVAYSSGDHKHLTEMTFRNGNVTETVKQPNKKRGGANWVPVSEADLRAVLDPLSGLVFPGDAKVCPRALPIFDGESRITLHMTSKGVRPFSTKGFSGDAIVCGVRFEPKSGYRTSSSSIAYLKAARDMEVWFARSPVAGIYAPVYAKVPTKVGKVIVSATRYGG